VDELDNMSIYLNDYDDDFIRTILRETQTIAIVGLSNNENRPSFFAASYLKKKGYKIIPVNPKLNGEKILGEKVYSKLSEIGFVPDLVDIFLKSENVIPIVEEAISVSTKTIWLQIGVINTIAYKLAKKAKIKFVMNKCTKIEFARFSGELGWTGINSKVISNKRTLLKNEKKNIKVLLLVLFIQGLILNKQLELEILLFIRRHHTYL